MRKKYLYVMITVSFLLVNVSETLPFQNKPGLSLRETFDIYVKSCQNSDLENLFSTVTDNEDFYFLTSTGELINTREGYYKFHEDWFNETDWEMPVELVKVHEGKEFGYTLAIFYYKSKMPDNTTYNLDSYFTLIFHKENGMWKVIADTCTPIKKYYTEHNAEISYTSDQIFLFNIIRNRRTVRKFKSTPVPEEHIMKILDAASFAPTAGNQQPWKFLVIRNRDKLDRLKPEALSWHLEIIKEKRKLNENELEKIKESLKNSLENILSAPVYIAALVDKEAPYPDYVVHDGNLAVENLMIAARALGYGTGYFTSYFPEEKMKAFFNIPDRYKLLCFTPVGIPDEWPKPKEKKELDDIIVFESF